MSMSPNAHEQQATRGSFCKLLLVPNGLDGAIRGAFEPWFEGEWTKTIKLKISTYCIWEVSLKEEDVNIFMDAHSSAFVKAHVLKIGYFMVFKNIDTRSLKAVVTSPRKVRVPMHKC